MGWAGLKEQSLKFLGECARECSLVTAARAPTRS